jgi:hypothetical protein
LTLCGLFLLGCGSASWQKVEIDDNYRPPRELTVAVVARPGLTEVSQALQSGLVDDLESHGIKARVVTAGALPDASLTIAKWDPGSRALRWASSGFGGKAEILIEVDSVGVDGTMYSTVTGGFFGGSAENAASSAGHAIGETLATGQKEPDPRANSRFAH